MISASLNMARCRVESNCDAHGGEPAGAKQPPATTHVWKVAYNSLTHGFCQAKSMAGAGCTDGGSRKRLLMTLRKGEEDHENTQPPAKAPRLLPANELLTKIKTAAKAGRSLANEQEERMRVIQDAINEVLAQNEERKRRALAVRKHAKCSTKCTCVHAAFSYISAKDFTSTSSCYLRELLLACFQYTSVKQLQSFALKNFSIN